MTGLEKLADYLSLELAKDSLLPAWSIKKYLLSLFEQYEQDEDCAITIVKNEKPKTYNPNTI
jgi:hypothetical protein